MDGRRIEALCKRLAAPRSRRQALRAGLLGAAATALARLGAAAQATPQARNAVAANNSTLFVQTATGGALRPNPAAAPSSPAGTPTTARHGAYVLTLTGHNGETIAFADRPQRDFGEVKTVQFFKSMGFTPANPPNAALVADTPQQADAVLLVELMNPTYDAGTRTLTYEANLLHQYPNARGAALAPLAAKPHAAPPAATFGGASLFIDDCPDLTQCGYYVVDVFYSVGPLPSGPIAMCWSSSSDACVPCDPSVSVSALALFCDQAYPRQCGGTCQAD